MKIRITLMFGTLAAMASAATTAADTPGAACSLLTPADVEAVTGSKSGAGTGTDQDVPMGPGKHVTMHACLWPVSSVRGQVAASVAPLPPGQSAQSLAKNNPGMDALRAAHYSEETKDFGTTTCSGMTPPATVKDGIGMFACTGEVQGKIVSVTFTSPTKKLSLEQTKALFDKALARLH